MWTPTQTHPHFLTPVHTRALRRTRGKDVSICSLPLSLHTHQCKYSTHTQGVGAALCSRCTYAFVSANYLLFPRLHSFFDRACTHIHSHVHPHTAHTFTHTLTHTHLRAHTFTHTPTRSDRCIHIESPNISSPKHASEFYRVAKLHRTSHLSRSFSQKSLIIHGSFLEKDLQLQVSFHKRAYIYIYTYIYIYDMERELSKETCT